MRKPRKTEDRFTIRPGDITVTEEGDDDGPRVTIVDGDWDELGNPRSDDAKALEAVAKRDKTTP